MNLSVHSQDSLLEVLKVLCIPSYDLIVIDGSECVGKTNTITAIQENFGLKKSYRPDYSYWESAKLPMKDRWVIFMSAIDMFKAGIIKYEKPTLLFDRGVLSGCVYNRDENLLKTYLEQVRSLAGDLDILHILVTPATRDDHKNFLDMRYGVNSSEDSRYQRAFTLDRDFRDLFGYLKDIPTIDTMVYHKKFIPDLIDFNSCLACTHCRSNICTNPEATFYKENVSTRCRCKNSTDKEIQDKEIDDVT